VGQVSAREQVLGHHRWLRTRGGAYSFNYISQRAVTNIQIVQGQGVVGHHPRFDDESAMNNWTFAYQSCTHARTVPGSMRGHFSFVTGSLERPSGPEFEVTVPAFALTVPEFIY
jgi:uncharacterized protein affecting Mg2+/Co2+ transport